MKPAGTNGLDTVERVALWLGAADALSDENREALLADLQDMAEQRLETTCKRLGVTLDGLPHEQLTRKLEHVVHGPDATPADRAAYRLMTWCIAARFDPDGLDEIVRMNILTAYAGLFDDLVELGDAMSRGRKVGAVGPVRKWVERYLAKHPTAKPAQAWAALARKPPKGIAVYTGFAPYLWVDGKGEVSHKRFQNLVAEVRRAQK